MALKRILVADDEESIRWVLSKALAKKGYQVDLAEDGEQAMRQFQQNDYDLAILDIKMPEISGLELLKRMQEQQHEALIVIMTAESTMENAVEAMKSGAYDYLTKPFDLGALDAILLKAEKATEVSHQIGHLKEELQGQYRLERTLIGTSPAMQDVYKVIGRVAPSNATVLIIGESGTGKELVARAMHFNSPRLTKPFVALNCAAIPRELLESELFGHEKGSFTGATERKAGKFEQANGGTVFLDEIGDMPLELQAKLLRVLQEKEVTRTGGTATIPVDVRIIAATNQDLTHLVRDKKFREDLYFRLNVVPLSLPPLRERPQDIPLLVEFFLNKLQQDTTITARECGDDTMELLQKYGWPGNVRELENAIHRAALLCPNPVLSPCDFNTLEDAGLTSPEDDSLEDLIRKKLNKSLAQMDLHELDNLYDLVLEQMERPLINIILDKTRGNQVRTAEILGINRNTLRKKVKHLNIDVKRGN